MNDRLRDSPAYARAHAAGRAVFGSRWTPSLAAQAPGRLELLGNHLDYNGGPVLCAAIDRRVVVLLEENEGGRSVFVVMADAGDPQPVQLDSAELRDWRNPTPPPDPNSYVRGMIAGALSRGSAVRTGRAAIAGDVPIGFGLSSSAALCVALTLAVHDPTPGGADLVLRAQEAEHRAGTPCGTMDQSASVAGGVIRYDGATLAVERIEPDLGDFVFAVADSGVHRVLGSSSYPVRVEESREALTIACEALHRDVPHLASLTRDDLDRLEELPETILSRRLTSRLRHVVSETERVAAGEAALRSGDWPTFGRLMTASGRSSAVDYEISHPRVEELVAEALAVDGVLGARMMGGGEGGTALILLPARVVPALRDRLVTGYFARHGMGADPYLLHVFGFSAGAALNSR